MADLSLLHIVGARCFRLVERSSVECTQILTDETDVTFKPFSPSADYADDHMKVA